MRFERFLFFERFIFPRKPKTIMMYLHGQTHWLLLLSLLRQYARSRKSHIKSIPHESQSHIYWIRPGKILKGGLDHNGGVKHEGSNAWLPSKKSVWFSDHETRSCFDRKDDDLQIVFVQNIWGILLFIIPPASVKHRDVVIADIKNNPRGNLSGMCMNDRQRDNMFSKILRPDLSTKWNLVIIRCEIRLNYTFFTNTFVDEQTSLRGNQDISLRWLDSKRSHVLSSGFPRSSRHYKAHVSLSRYKQKAIVPRILKQMCSELLSPPTWARREESLFTLWALETKYT